MSEHTANDLRLYSETTINELVAANWAMDDEIKKLRAENARLREASERLLSALLPGKVVHMGHEHVRYSATYSIAGWNPVLELQALLGGGG
jgi:hypothetical protein